MSINDERWEEYFISGTNVLKNKLQIIDREELIKKEVEITFEKLLELQVNPVKMDFDEEHLRAIHRYLFDDIYYFAGEYRNVYMGKNNSYFATVDEIPLRLHILFSTMDDELKQVQSKFGFACFLTEVYAELMNIHPFREGNGRAIREFIREYANEKSKYLSFGEINFSWANVNTEIVNEYIDKARAFRSFIEIEFLNAFEMVDKIDNYNR